MFETMLPGEEKERLKLIVKMIDEFYSETDMLCSTKTFLNNLWSIANPGHDEYEPETKVIISIASYVEDKQVAVGVVMERPDIVATTAPAINFFSERVPSMGTDILADYDAIYVGLTSFFGLVNNPGMPVEIRCPNLEVVQKLNHQEGPWSFTPEELRKANSVEELIQHLPVKIDIVWRPIQSSKAIKKANDLAYRTIVGDK